MTAQMQEPFTEDMLVRLRDAHKPTALYIVGRRERGIPTTGKPFEDREPMSAHPVEEPPVKKQKRRKPRLTAAHCAAEYWKSCVDLAFTAQANPDYEQIRKEVETWHRFATHNHAF